MGWGGVGWQERAVGARGVRAEKTQDQDACVRDGKAAGPGGVHTLAWRAPRWPSC